VPDPVRRTLRVRGGNDEEMAFVKAFIGGV
jgi:hypothetical protein